LRALSVTSVHLFYLHWHWLAEKYPRRNLAYFTSDGSSAVLGRQSGVSSTEISWCLNSASLELPAINNQRQHWWIKTMNHFKTFMSPHCTTCYI
jgi:hypothetical protein